MTLISLPEADEEKQLVNSQNTACAAEPQCHEILFTNANIAVFCTLQSLRRPQESSCDVLRKAGLVHPIQSSLKTTEPPGLMGELAGFQAAVR